MAGGRPVMRRVTPFVARAAARSVTAAPATWPLWRPVVSRVFDRASDGWTERVAGRDGHFAALDEALAVRDRAVAAPPRTVLEVGTGTGAGAIRLAARYLAARVTGIDVSARMVAAAERETAGDPARAGGRLSFAVGDASRLDAPDAGIDLLVAVNCLPFAAEWARAATSLVVVNSFGDRTPMRAPLTAMARRFSALGRQAHFGATPTGGTYLVVTPGLPPADAYERG